MIINQKLYKANERLWRDVSKITGMEIQSKYCVENKKLSIKCISVEYFPNFVDPGINETKP